MSSVKHKFVNQTLSHCSHATLFQALTLVKNWQNVGSKEALTDAAFMGEQVFIGLFIKYDTPIHSCAAVESHFSLDVNCKL